MFLFGCEGWCYNMIVFLVVCLMNDGVCMFILFGVVRRIKIIVDCKILMKININV